MIEKIISKCDADIEAIEANSGRFPSEGKGKGGYRKRYMWRGASEGRRQINFVIDNIRWDDDDYSFKEKEDAASGLYRGYEEGG
jgi:hypothetical protein